MPRTRHCVECPKCHTRYVLSFSPYRNGSYLITTLFGPAQEEYALFCSCTGLMAVSRWTWNEVKICKVSKAAYKRGYGTADEILLIRDHPHEDSYVDVSKYVNRWKVMEERCTASNRATKNQTQPGESSS